MRPKLLGWVRLVAVLAIAGVVMTGVSAGASTHAAKPVQGGTFTLVKGAEQAAGWDPTQILGVPTNSDVPGSFAIYDTLMFEDPVNLKLVPRLAESMTTTDGGKTWTVKLRPNVKFSDGTPFDAAAVQYNWERIADPATKARRAVTAQQIQTYQVVDPTTLKVTLKDTDPNFNRRTAYHLFAIASPTALKTLGSSFATKPVGAGPFVLKEWIRDTQQTYVRNENYWEKGKPYLDSVIVKIIVDDTQKFNTVQSGGANGTIIFNPPLAAQFAATEGFQSLSMSANGGGWGLQYNHSKPPFNDARVRQAFTLAIDRNEFNKVARAGDKNSLLTHIETDTSPYYDAKQKLPKYNLAEAQKLVDAYVSSVNGGKPISASLLLFANGYTPNDGQLIQAMLQRLKNVEVKLETAATTAVIGRYTAGDFQFYMGGIRWTDPAIDMVDYFLSTGTQNVTTLRYNNPAADAAGRQLAAATTQADKVKFHHQLADVVLSDYAFTFITKYESTQIYDKAVKNFENYFDQRILLDEVWMSKPKS